MLNPDKIVSLKEGRFSGVIKRGEERKEVILLTTILLKNKELSYHDASCRALCIQTSLNEGLHHTLNITI